MTLLTTTTRQSFACDGVSQDFPIAIDYFDKAGFQVWLKDSASGAELLLASENDYWIEGEAEGSAHLHTSIAHPAGKTLTLLRRTALQQAVDYVENDPFPAATHERALDLAAARDQELAERLDRVIGVGPSDGGNLTLPPAVARAGKALIFDAGGGVAVSQDTYVDQAGAAALSATAAASSAATALSASTVASDSALSALTASAAALAAADGVEADAGAASSAASTATAAAAGASGAATTAAASASAAAASASSASTQASAAAASAGSAASSAAAAATSAGASASAQSAAEAARNLAQTYGAALSGTSSSSVTVGVGSKVFSTQSGKAWIAGQRLRAASADGSLVLDGEVVVYGGGSLTLAVDYTEGSGSHADWSLSLIGPRGPAGVGTTADNVSFVPAGGIASTNLQSALAELDSEKLSTSGGDMTGRLTVALAGTAPIPLFLTAIDESANGGISYRVKQTTTPAPFDIIWDDASFSYDTGGSLQLYTRYRSYVVDPTAGSEHGGFQWYAAQAGAQALQAELVGGVFDVPTDLRVGGISINSIGRQTVFVPAGAMTPRQSSGAALNTTESATNRINYQSLDFDPSLVEYAQFQLAMPKSWNESSISARFIWLSAAGTGDVVWAIQAAAISDDDPLDAAFGTAVSPNVTDGVDGVTAASDVMVSPETATFAAAGSPSSGDLVVFQVYRNAVSGADSLAADARLLGVVLYYTTDAASDA